MIGKTVSRYKILEKLGEGGMGVVYKAQDTKLKRTVALKFLPPDFTRDSEAKVRFMHEAQAAAALNHPNICTVHEIDEADGQIFIATECIEGETLKDKIASGPMKINEALSIVIQIAEGLQEAHEKGIVHRDIKSANVMVTPKGQAKVMDFGLAKLAGATKVTKMGSTVGTISYMSPEQARGDTVDQRSDVWSLGVVLYEMLTGQLPFRGDYCEAVVYSILNGVPEPITSLRTGVPMELERIVGKALAKSPDDRYQNVADLLVDLRVVTKAQKAETVPHPLPTPGPRKKSIAVLPFKSLSESKEDEYFSDGTTEDIIAHLAKIGDLKVISRTSIMLYKDSKKCLREIGQELNVATILEGSIRRAGGRVRIVSQLIDAETDEHIWAETYDRDMEDIFAIQSDVAQKIAMALRAQLSAEEKARIEKKPTESLTAYDYYLKGREYYYRYRKEDNENAIELFKKALTIDPGYALGYAGLADAYCQRVHRFGFAPTWVDSAIEVSERAISIDPSCAEAHKALGVGYAVKGWESKALKAYRKAVELNPNYAPATSNLANRYVALGEYVEALKWQKKARSLAPTSPGSHLGMGTCYRALGEDAEAEIWLSKALDLQPDYVYAHAILIDVYLGQSRFDEARAQVQKVLSVAPNELYSHECAGYVELIFGNYERARKYYERAKEIWSPWILGSYISIPIPLAYVYLKTGLHEEAGQLLTEGLAKAQKKLEQGDERSGLRYEMAAISAIQGKKKQAYEWLRKAIDAGWRDYRLGSIDPLFENLHGDEQFKTMMAEVKAMVDEMRKRLQEAGEV